MGKKKHNSCTIIFSYLLTHYTDSLHCNESCRSWSCSAYCLLNRFVRLEFNHQDGPTVSARLWQQVWECVSTKSDVTTAKRQLSCIQENMPTVTMAGSFHFSVSQLTWLLSFYTHSLITQVSRAQLLCNQLLSYDSHVQNLLRLFS